MGIVSCWCGGCGFGWMWWVEDFCVIIVGFCEIDDGGGYWWVCLMVFGVCCGNGVSWNGFLCVGVISVIVGLGWVKSVVGWVVCWIGCSGFL